MLIHKLAIMGIPEPCSVLEQATVLRHPQPSSVLIYCPEQAGTLRLYLPTPLSHAERVKTRVICSSQPASTMPGMLPDRGKNFSLARQVRGMARLEHSLSLAALCSTQISSDQD